MPAKKKSTKKPVRAKPAPLELTSSQHELLRKVHVAGERGYSIEKKIEERSLSALLERRLVKKGAKDKATGKVPYTLSAAGRKHVESAGAGGPGGGTTPSR